ncbi:MAG TPA: AMP-binding protein, partial [Xanthomonadaceae bacterium]|nr:AMP-binding protein [Xanthomonadaceae bacterium]
GLTSIIPDMDPTRPAQADPRRLLHAIERFGVSQLFGSPALVAVLARHGAPLPGVRRVTSAGAPVPAEVVARMRSLLPAGAQLWTPYGATECLPVAVIEGRELETTRAATERGAGTCVGRAVAPNQVRIIRIGDDAIATWSDDLLVAPGQVGEITVAGPTATDTYWRREEATRLSKIREVLADAPPSAPAAHPSTCPGQALLPQAGEGEACAPFAAAGEGNPGAAAVPPLRPAGEGRGEGAPCGERIVHRMGDLGWMDDEGRLWFCGRKSQRVVVDATTTLCTEQVEPVFNTHADVRRSALVGVGARGAQRPVLCVELREGVPAREWPRIERELRHLGDGFVHTAKVAAFLRHPRFPVDIRHNAKIGRETLALWAARRLPGGAGA